jgi:hypothetical protein
MDMFEYVNSLPHRSFVNLLESGTSGGHRMTNVTYAEVITKAMRMF